MVKLAGGVIAIGTLLKTVSDLDMLIVANGDVFMVTDPVQLVLRLCVTLLGVVLVLGG